MKIHQLKHCIYSLEQIYICGLFANVKDCFWTRQPGYNVKSALYRRSTSHSNLGTFVMGDSMLANDSWGPVYFLCPSQLRFHNDKVPRNRNSYLAVCTNWVDIGVIGAKFHKWCTTAEIIVSQVTKDIFPSALCFYPSWNESVWRKKNERQLWLIFFFECSGIKRLEWQELQCIGWLLMPCCCHVY